MLRLVFENTYFRLILFSINFYGFYFSEINNANKGYEKECCGIKAWSWDLEIASFQSYKIVWLQDT